MHTEISPYLRGVPEKIEYPHFPGTYAVSLAPDKVALLSPADMKALLEAFQCLTGFRFEGAKEVPEQRWERFLEHAGAREGGHGLRFLSVTVPKK